LSLGGLRPEPGRPAACRLCAVRQRHARCL